MGGDGVALGQQHGLLEHVAQLAHVAGPAVIEHQLFGLITEMQVWLAIAFAMSRQKVAGQQQNVFPPGVQARHLDRDDTQTEKQVAAELALLDHLFKVAVGGADHPQIDFALLDRTDPANRPVLQQLQQLGLQQQVHFTDLIEKQRAAIGRFDQTEATVLGVGERALLVAEQLRLHQVGRNRGAVEFDERPFGAWTVEMQGPGHQLLAGAGFAFHQYRWQIGVGHAAFGVEQLADGALEVSHRCRLTDQCLHPGFLRFAFLVERQRALHPISGQGLVQQQLELWQGHRFGHVMECAFFHRHHGVFDIAVARHHDHFQIRRADAQSLDQVVTAHARQGVVGQHDVGNEGSQLLQRVFRRVADGHLEVLALQVGLNILGEQFIILDQQYAVLHIPLPLPL